MNQRRTRTAKLQLKKVEELRQSKGLTIEDLASKVRVDVRNVRRWMDGKGIYLNNLAALAAVLGTTTDAIRSDMPETSVLACPQRPRRFVIKMNLKGYFQSDQQRQHLLCLTQNVVQELARNGIVVTGQNSTSATARFAGASAWRRVIGVPAMSDGRPSWAVVALIPARLAAFAECPEFHDDAFNHGEILASGWGRKVPLKTWRRVLLLCDWGIKDVTDLTADYPTR